MTDTIDVTGTYMVGRKDELSFVDQTGFVLHGPAPRLIVAGQIDLSFSEAESVGYGVTCATDVQTPEVDITARGAITLTQTAEGGAGVGVGLTHTGAQFNNAGHLTVTSTAGAAYGVWHGSDVKVVNRGTIEVDARDRAGGILGGPPDATITNLGHILVHSTSSVAEGAGGDIDNRGEIDVSSDTGYAFGAEMNEDQSLDNSGTITARGAVAAVAVTLQDCADLVVNSGRLLAVSKAGFSAGIEILATHDDTPLEIRNTGLIQAGVAVLVETAPYLRAVTLTNLGQMRGDLEMGAGADHVDNQGKIHGDILLGAGADTYGGTGRHVGEIHGGDGADLILAGRSGDLVYGEADNDVLSGGHGSDLLSGGDGSDTLDGGLGVDTLQGGTGTDTFEFARTTESRADSPDHILDLENGDSISLGAIDANTGLAGNQAFVLVSALDGHAGELALSYDAGSDTTTLAADTDGDGQADMVVLIAGDHHSFSSFVL